MEVFTIKLVGAIILWLCMTFFGLMPLRVKRFRTNQTLLSVSNCFSGGLFIAIGLIHILPEAHAKLEGKDEAWYLEHDREVFPLSYLICLATFSFILLVDRVVFSNSEIAGLDDLNMIDIRKSMLRKQHEIFDEDQDNFKEFVSSKYKVALKLSKYRRSKTDVLICDDEEHHRLHSPIAEESDDEASCKSLQSHERLLKQNSMPVKSRTELIKHSPEFEVSDESDSAKIHEMKKPTVPTQHHHVHSQVGHHHHHKMVSSTDNVLAAYILLLAMGIHGFFAGIAFGISDSKAETLDMFLAMVSHKWSEALTVGISFVAADIAYDTSFYMILFLSFITPLGIFVGYLLSGMSDTVIGVALAVSSGTFIYISCAEIIVEEFALGAKKYWKFLAYTLGILFIALVGLIE